jgi:hypothetical protein
MAAPAIPGGLNPQSGTTAITGNLTVSGTATIGGVTATDGVTFDPQAANPGATHTLWKSSGDGKLYIGSTEVGSGGGGSGSGDVVGPASAVDDRIATFDGITGKIIQDGGSTIANVLDRANHTGTQLLNTISNAGGAAALNVGTTAGTVAAGDDARLSDARTPTAHAASHTNGTDDIQSATAAQKGLATAAQITKLDAIEALADVTDAGNVGAAIHGATAETTLGDTDKIPLTQSGTLKTIAYSALKTLLNAIYARLPLVKTLDDAATIAVDCESRNNVIAAVTVTASRALGEPSNVAVGSKVRIKWIQNATGGYVLSAHANYVWIGNILPTMSTAPNSQTWLDFEGASGNVLNHVETIYR